MNTKLIMTLSAIFLLSAGIFLTFAPDLMLNFLNLETNQTSLFLIQLIGALYFGFGMLNWMNKGRPIGGIYNRPVAISNLCHFMVAGLALLKGITSTDLPFTIYILAAVYAVFGIAFGIILFRNPTTDKS